MSGTEAKYYLHAAHEVSKDGGIAAIMVDTRCLDVPVNGGLPLFPDIPNTRCAASYCDLDPAIRIRSLSDTLRSREPTGKHLGSSLIAGTSAFSFYGNQAVYGLAYKLLTRTTGLSIQPSAAFKHAEAHEEVFFSQACEASNLNPVNCAPTFKNARGTREDHTGEHAADYIKSIYRQGNSNAGRRRQGKFASQFRRASIRQHCLQSSTGADIINGSLSVDGKSTTLADICNKHLHEIRVRNSNGTDTKSGEKYSRTYVAGNALYWVCRSRTDESDPPKRTFGPASYKPRTDLSKLPEYKRHLGPLAQPLPKVDKAPKYRRPKFDEIDPGIQSTSHTSTGECYVLYERDRRDLCELLLAFDALCCYRRGRLLEIMDPTTRTMVAETTGKIIEVWLEICKEAGRDRFLASNVGTLLDQVVWICLANLAGDKYFDHPTHMRGKAVSKVPAHVHFVDRLVYLFEQLPVDERIGYFGLNKLSLYPQVCAYGTVHSQLELHSTPNDCTFASGSTIDLQRRIERDEMFVYMRYLYIRIFITSYKYAPGRVKPGVEHKPWHDRYKANGVPSGLWRECVDIDLRGTMPIGKPDFDTYLTLADRACAPSNPKCYASFGDYASAPTYEKRKLLYFLQNPDLPDVSQIHAEFCRIGDTIPKGSVDHVAIPVDFSVDISTGIRFERQKPAGRPFYQLCAVMGCLCSNLEAAVRYWLKKVPQSLMSMSLKDRVTSAILINDPDIDYRSRFMVSDDKEKYSPQQDPESQVGTAEFFAEVTNDSSFKTVINILTTNELYYRVHDRLVHYPSNGTDREGLRGAQNTWLEIVCHGYHTRRMKEEGIYKGSTSFIGFIDDALRRYMKEIRESDVTAGRVREIVADLEEKLRIIGRKLSWDKAYVSETLSTILGEVFYCGIPMANGSKSFVSFNDLDLKVVEDASSMEENFASKAIGAQVAGAVVPCCMYMYIHNTMKMHHNHGVRVGPRLSQLEYCLWCLTPLALGGAGMRTPIELASTESGNRTTAGIGSLCRLAAREQSLIGPLNNLLDGPFEEVSDMDFMREPTQFHVTGPRIRTQRVTQYVRTNIHVYATSPAVSQILNDIAITDERLITAAKEFRKFKFVDKEEIIRYYNGSAHSKLDSLVTKVCTSDTLKSLLDKTTISRLRKQVKKDTMSSSIAFRYRLLALPIPDDI